MTLRSEDPGEQSGVDVPGAGAEPGLMITRWRDLKANRGARTHLTVAQLVAELSAPVVCSERTEAPGYSLAVCKLGRRAAESVEVCTGIALDYDSGAVSVAEAVAAWGAFRGVVHTTFRHTAEAPRFRVVLVLARPVTPEVWKRLWAALARRARVAGHTIDPKTCDPCRYWFVAACPEERRDLFEARELTGALMDAEDELAGEPPAEGELPVMPATTPASAPAAPKPQPAAAPAAQPTKPASKKRARAWAEKGLKDACAAIRAAREGTVNNTLNEAAYSVAGHIPDGWLDEREAHDALLQAALDAGHPKDRAESTLRSAFASGKARRRDAAQEAADAPDPGKPSRAAKPAKADDTASWWTEKRRAEAFAERYRGKAAYHPANGWYAWNGRYWQCAGAELLVRGMSMEFSGECVRRLYADPDVADKSKAGLAVKLESAAAIASTVRLAEPLMLVEPGWVDGCDPWLLNCQNGTLDLRTGELRAPSPGDRCLHIVNAAYDPQALCPLWDAFLDLTQPDAEKRAFLQRLAGYALTGVVREHVFPVMQGSGGNGKSTLFGTLAEIMGRELAITIKGKSLMERRGEQHETEIARFYGKRLIVSEETEKNAPLNEALVKELTGGSQLSARFMMKDHFSWKPTHKLLMVTNPMPIIKGTDDGIWRRMLLVNWGVSIKEKVKEDTAFSEKLRAEWPGILAWAVRGCLEWQTRGLDAPASVQLSTANYKGESDVLGSFIKDACVTKPLARMRAANLYAAFLAWCKECGVAEITQTAFGRDLTERGFERKTIRGTRVYVGIELAPTEEEPGEDNSDTEGGRADDEPSTG